jgi:predicted transglutaminase-like protease
MNRCSLKKKFRSKDSKNELRITVKNQKDLMMMKQKKTNNQMAKRVMRTSLTRSAKDTKTLKRSFPKTKTKIIKQIRLIKKCHNHLLAKRLW